MCENSCGSMSSSACPVISISYFSHFSRYVVASVLFLFAIPLMPYNAEHFHKLINHICIFFEELSIIYFELGCYYYCWILQVLCILLLEVFYQICVFANISLVAYFFYLLCFFPILITVSFVE